MQPLGAETSSAQRPDSGLHVSARYVRRGGETPRGNRAALHHHLLLDNKHTFHAAQAALTHNVLC